MEGFCRGCLIKYNEPMELLQYTEKNRRLFVYSTGLQVKRNDTFTFQLCKDCFLNMKQACKFKKNCRISDKRFRNYVALKDVGDPVDFCTFLKNSDDTLTFRLPMTSGNSTPATQKCKDDDNESTCTSIRNFMTAILQGEEMPDTEARIIKEVIEEEADLLDDSLDSHWLQDDMSIDTDFRLDFSFSAFSTPRSVNNDNCYTPKQKEEEITFDTINTEKQTKILNDFTNAFKMNENIEELSIFVGDVNDIEKKERLCPFGIDEIDDMGKSEIDSLKNKENLKRKSKISLVNNLDIDEIDGMETSDSKTVESNQNLKELCDFGLEEINSVHETENNTLESNENLKELCDFSLDGFSHKENAESKTLKNVQILKGLCDFSLDSIGSIEKPASNINKNNESLKEFYDLSLNHFDDTVKSGNTEKLKTDQNVKELDLSLTDFDDTAKSGSNTFKTDENVKELDLSLTDFDDISISGSNTFKPDPNIKEICDFGIDDINGTERSQSNLDLPSLSDVLERDKIDTLDFDIPKGVIDSIQANTDMSNSSINIKALFKDKPCTIDTNLEEALKNTDSKQFSLDDLLVSPRVFPAESAASTPTITNILFGEKLETTYTNTKIEKCIEPYHDIQGDIEIFEEFFQNETKEFDIEDIIRENGGFKSGDWKKPIAVNGVEVNNKENESKNIDMDISIDDTTVTESKNDDIIYISHTSPNDKFNIEYLYCKLCKIRYDTSRALSVHLTKSHKIKIVRPKTRNCNKNTSKNEAIINVSEISSNDKFDMKNSYCKLCEIKYDTGRALSVHFSKTHNIKIEKPKNRKYGISGTPETESKNQPIINFSDTTPNDKFDIEKLYCKLCKKKFRSGRALSIHLSITHKIKIKKTEYDRKNRTEQLCNNCGMKCGDSTNFARHVKICQLKESEGRIFKCDHCLQEFKTRFYLEKHKISHTNMKRKKATGKEFVCTICGAIVHKQSNYALHMRRHMKDYSAKCEYCDKGFYRKSDLRAHMRKHTGDTPFSCTFCPKLFARRDVLLRHILTHLGEKFFECDYCGLKCIKKYDLIIHIKNKSCRKVEKAKKKTKTGKKENMDIDITEEQEEKVEEEVEVQKEEVRKVKKAKKKNKTDKNENKDIDITQEQERIEVPKEKVTVIYAKGSDASIRKQLPFLETGNIPEEQEEEKVEVKNEEVTVIYAKGSDATIRKQLPFFETGNIPEEQEEEKVEVKNEEVTVYAKGSDATIRKQLPFLETERSN